MEKLNTASRALETFESILSEPFSEIVRDATIQRFEYSFEVCWKALKEYLNEEEGIVCNSPKSCFRSAFQSGLLSEKEAGMTLKMTDERNLTSHTYIEEIAQRVYEQAPEFAGLMRGIIEAMRVRLENSSP